MMIGIVVPCRNRHVEYGEAIESLVSQDDVTKTILVVDDGSNPPLEQKFSGRTSIIHTDGVGIQRARNIGYWVLKKLAPESSYVLFADGDKVWRKGSLRLLLETLRESRSGNSSIGYAYGPFRRSSFSPEVFIPPEWGAHALRRQNYVDGASLIYRPALENGLGRHELWIEDEDRLQDWSLWLRLLNARVIGVRVLGDEPLFETQFPEGSISARGAADYRYWYKRIRERYCHHPDGAVSAA